MDTKQVCKECGGPLPANAPQGLCPKCLMKVAMGSEAGNPDVPRERIPAVAPAELARHFPQLEIVELLGQGGMGAVYKARQRSLNRVVAVKMILSAQFAGKQFGQRFRNEAAAAAILQHPNIVAIHDVGVQDGQQFFSMNYVEGQNLAQLVGNRPLPPARSCAR